jgi:hypothetical protein
MNWLKKAKKSLKEKYNPDTQIDKCELCVCCFKKYREEYAVDFNDVFLRASNLDSRISGEYSPYYNLIRLNKMYLKRLFQLKTVDDVISHELEHALIYRIMRRFGFSEEVSDIGSLCVSKPSQFDLKDLREKLHKRKPKKYA